MLTMITAPITVSRLLVNSNTLSNVRARATKQDRKRMVSTRYGIHPPAYPEGISIGTPLALSDETENRFHSLLHPHWPLCRAIRANNKMPFVLPPLKRCDLLRNLRVSPLANKSFQRRSNPKMSLRKVISEIDGEIILKKITRIALTKASEFLPHFVRRMLREERTNRNLTII